ncbi:hypothetical protein [Planctomicrobium piriforme]|uniref:hypothetical protein n=1 Tax=Planctomicrobium piriforme TaxID=1576369 RepID=UPI0011143EB8|nr:hypothetical protein [Planctomicrobium piriforme]
MQSRRRLKLAVVLLMAAGLMGGVACWHSPEPPLNAEELRFVGRWEYAGNKAIAEYRPDRTFTSSGNETWVLHRWRVSDGILTVTSSNSGSYIPLPEKLYDAVRLLPFFYRFTRPHAAGEFRYRIHWHDKDVFEKVSIGGNKNEDGQPYSFLMHRIPEDK